MKLTITFTAVVLCLASIVHNPALAQDDNYLCYWRNPDGTMRDLSSFCKKPSQTTLSPDAAFVANFRSMASQYPDNIRQELDSYIKQDTDSAIASAKVTCQVLRFGGARAASTRMQAIVSDASAPSEQARKQIINSLAINQYCPEFASR